MACADDCCKLSLDCVIGFNGSIANSLQYTPCGKYAFYSLGSTVVLRCLVTNNVVFLDAENDAKVSCLAVSKDGNFLASGHDNELSNKVDVVFWDMKQAQNLCDEGKRAGEDCLLHRFPQHHGKVQAIDFSCDASFLATLGGQNDNNVIVWNVSTGKPISGSAAASDSALCVRWLNKRNDRFVTCGNYHCRVWQVCTKTPKMHHMDVVMGTMRREMQCLAISSDDKFAFAGSKTGEVLKFTIDRDEITKFNEMDQLRPALQDYSRNRFSKGVKSVACITNPITGNTNILMGAGDGTVQILNPKLIPIESHVAKLNGAVTSISVSPDSKRFYAGTNLSQRYAIEIATFKTDLCGTCHYGEINDVKFPKNCSDLFVTASVQDIRVWNRKLRQELIRIVVPNLICRAIELDPDGTCIVSAWSDGKIRAFLPESGKSEFIIPEAHLDGVTALSICGNHEDVDHSWRFVSGGKDGKVRVWKVLPSHQTMIHSMKEHRGEVHSIMCNQDGTRAISSSSDASCIIWDIRQGIRITALFEPAIFTNAVIHPDESQYLTCGTHKKITYWDAYDASAIREIEGGTAEMTCLEIASNGNFFISGSADRLLRLWDYDDGITLGIGKGHSGKVNKVAFSPDLSTIVSVGSEGGIFMWSVPPGLMQRGKC